MQCRCLGAAVEAWSEPDAERPRPSLIDEVGELVCTQPMPSMPLCFWGDADGQRAARQLLRHVPGHLAPRRLDPHHAAPRVGAAARSSTAAATRPSTATASAWARPSCTARSRRCPRCSTAWSSTSSTSAARATCRCSSCCAKGSCSTTRSTRRIKSAIRAALSARHVPNEIFQVTAIPRTLSGKKMELPVKKLLMGADPASVLKRDAMANADSVDWFVAFARRARPELGLRREAHDRAPAAPLCRATSRPPCSRTSVGCCGCRSAPPRPGCRRC